MSGRMVATAPLAGFPYGPHDAALARADATQPGSVGFSDYMSTEFRRRWTRYVCHCWSMADGCRYFGVSERAYRRWERGDGGVNGIYVGMAMEHHPARAAQFLFPQLMPALVAELAVQP